MSVLCSGSVSPVLASAVCSARSYSQQDLFLAKLVRHGQWFQTSGAVQAASAIRYSSIVCHPNICSYLSSPTGSVVRFGPNDVSINTATALQEIYGSRKPNIIKSDWYTTVQLAEGGRPSTFSVRDRAHHAQKRRLLARALSESAIRDTEPHILEQIQKWCSILGRGAAKGEWTEGRNMATFSDYLSFDVLSDLCFGKSFDVLEKEDNRFIVHLIPNATSSGYNVSTPARLV